MYMRSGRVMKIVKGRKGCINLHGPTHPHSHPSTPSLTHFTDQVSHTRKLKYCDRVSGFVIANLKQPKFEKIEKINKMSRVVKLKRNGGKIVQDCDIYIGRAMYMGGWKLPKSKWCNPYKVGEDGSREEVLKKYEKYVRKNRELMTALPELKGKVLGCWCKPLGCHGDVLVKLLQEMKHNKKVRFEEEEDGEAEEVEEDDEEDGEADEEDEDEEEDDGEAEDEEDEEEDDGEAEDEEDEEDNSDEGEGEAEEEDEEDNSDEGEDEEDEEDGEAEDDEVERPQKAKKSHHSSHSHSSHSHSSHHHSHHSSHSHHKSRTLTFVPHPLFSERIPSELRQAVQSETLSIEMLNKYSDPSSPQYSANFTALVVIASSCSYAKPLIENHLKINGVPLVEGFSYYPHQIDALKFMLKRESEVKEGIRGGMLSLKMGLGKTFVGLSHILMTSPSQSADKFKGALVVCSKSVVNVWIADAKKFFGDNIKVLVFLKNKLMERGLTREYLKTFDVVITTYDTVMSIAKKHGFVERSLTRGIEGLMTGKIIEISHPPRSASDRSHSTGFATLFTTPWRILIADESQRFANPSTATFKCMMSLWAEKYWCFTGTPIRNSGLDLWAQLRFIGYNAVTSPVEWNKTGMERYRKDNLSSVIMHVDYKNTTIKLPPKEERDVLVNFTKDEKTMYLNIHTLVREAFIEAIDKPRSFANVLALFTALRQTCIAAFLLSSLSKRTKTFRNPIINARLKNAIQKGGLTKWLYDQDGTSGMSSAKNETVIGILRTLPKDDKVVIFSSWTSSLDLLGRAISRSLPEFKFEHFDGGTSADERVRMLNNFSQDPKMRCLLMTYKTGAEGLNLTEATHVICLEPWWNRAITDQAKARVWRIGQTKNVIIYNIIVEGTIETKMLQICQDKTEIVDFFLGTNYSAFKPKRLTREELGKMLDIPGFCDRPSENLDPQSELPIFKGDKREVRPSEHTPVGQSNQPLTIEEFRKFQSSGGAASSTHVDSRFLPFKS